MILWMTLTVMVTLAAVALVIPLVRRRDAAAPGASAVSILKGQLAELEAQEAAGAVAPDEAARLKLEIERRMLAEARDGEPPARSLGDKGMLRLAFGVAAGVAIGATLIYALTGRPDAPSAGHAASGAMPGSAEHPGGDIPAMISQLEAQVQANPGDAEGWRMLGWARFQVGQFAESADAYARAAVIEPQNPAHPSARGESLVQAADGQVTPEAAAAFRAALSLDPADPRARYFLAVQKDQAGDQDGAMADWIALVNEAPADAPWAGEVRRFVEDLARERGIDLAGRLRPAAASGVPARGPTAEQMAAAEQLSPEQRQAMIQGMVDGLEQQLAVDPNDAEGWVRLMRARMVQGDGQAAARALTNARRAFAGNAAGLAQVNEAARGLGVPGA